jgi:hypothetical protein
MITSVYASANIDRDGLNLDLSSLRIVAQADGALFIDDGAGEYAPRAVRSVEHVPAMGLVLIAVEQPVTRGASELLVVKSEEWAQLI